MKMKKIISGLLASALTITAGFMPGPDGISVLRTELTVLAGESGTCGKNVKWELSDDGELTISGTGEMSYIPFFEKEQIKSVVIEKGVTTISVNAFDKCTSLESVTIPDSVTEIGYSAFSGCTSLENINIPDSVTKIENYVFCGCTSLKNVTIPDSVTEIEYYAFRGCTSLENITIPDSVTKIGIGAFYDCTSLESINIPDSVTKIEEYLIGGCKSLKNINIPDSVTEIQDEAFAGCYRLPRYMVIPPTVKSIGYRAVGCVVFGNNLESEVDYNLIDNYVIYGTAGTEAEEYALRNGIIFIDTSKPVTISEKEYSLKTGNSTVLSVENFPGDIVWRSSDRSVADVSNGYVSAKSPGTAVIYAEAGKDTLSCEVTVSRWDDVLTLPGDVNGNGIVNVADLFMLRQYLVKKDALTNYANADLNRDGCINVFDAVSLKRKLTKE